MKKRVVSKRRSDCPLNATLEVFGDRWSLLIVRDLLFKGRTAYKDFLAGGEGIATNVLADRLRRLAVEGVIEKGRDQVDARRLVYRLTASGSSPTSGREPELTDLRDPRPAAQALGKRVRGPLGSNRLPLGVPAPYRLT